MKKNSFWLFIFCFLLSSFVTGQSKLQWSEDGLALVRLKKNQLVEEAVETGKDRAVIISEKEFGNTEPFKSMDDYSWHLDCALRSQHRCSSQSSKGC